ncbi:hypothetical protein NHX12_010687, partial [Muraenolepis orangiensis]
MGDPETKQTRQRNGGRTAAPGRRVPGQLTDDRCPCGAPPAASPDAGSTGPSSLGQGWTTCVSLGVIKRSVTAAAAEAFPILQSKHERSAVVLGGGRRDGPSLLDGEVLSLEDTGGPGPFLLANDSVLMRGLVVRSRSNQISIRFPGDRGQGRSRGSLLLSYR